MFGWSMGLSNSWWAKMAHHLFCPDVCIAAEDLPVYHASVACIHCPCSHRRGDVQNLGEMVSASVSW